MTNKSISALLNEYAQTENISAIRSFINKADPNTMEHKEAAFLYYQVFTKRDTGTNAYHLFAAAILEQAASQYHLVKGEEGLSLKQINQGFGDSDNLRKQAYRSIMKDDTYTIGQPVKTQFEEHTLSLINEQHREIFNKDIPLITQLCNIFNLQAQRDFVTDLESGSRFFSKKQENGLIFYKPAHAFDPYIEPTASQAGSDKEMIEFKI